MNKIITVIGIAICIVGITVANYYIEYQEQEVSAWEIKGGQKIPYSWVWVTKHLYPYLIIGLIILLMGSVTILVGCFMPTEPKTNIIICPRCGSRNTANSKFCVRCGSRLEVAKDED
jgi:ribosomal protein L40E